MPRAGIFEGFNFDPEVFADYMQEQSTFNTAIMSSGILISDPMLYEQIGGRGNVGSVPFFLNVDDEGDALNHDGETDNTPTKLKGGKQTFMAIARQKAWEETTFVRYLTGKSPLDNFANNLVVPYYANQWLKDLIAIMDGVLAISELSTHVTDISSANDTVTEANMVSLTTHIDAAQTALGDRRTSLSLFICHSMIATNLKKLELITYRKFTDPNTLEGVTLPVIGNMIVLETDNGTIDTSGTTPKYKTYMSGIGTFLTAPKDLDIPYYPDYDAETNGGVEKFYSKQAIVMHPNGVSMEVNNIAKESPTRAELADPANWKLAFKAKNIALVKIVSNG